MKGWETSAEKYKEFKKTKQKVPAQQCRYQFSPNSSVKVNVYPTKFFMVVFVDIKKSLNFVLKSKQTKMIKTILKQQ